MDKVPVDRLIILVSEHTELYDMSTKLYHNIHHKEAVWAQIGRILGCSGDASRRKWKYLRDKYKREKRNEKDRRSGSEGGFKRSWKFMGVMSFLDPHVQDRPTSTSFETPESIVDGMCESAGEESESAIGDSVYSGPPSPGSHQPPAAPPAAAAQESTPFRPQPNPSPAPAARGKRREVAPGLTQYQQQVLQSLQQDVDEHEHFLLSFAPALRRLEPRKQAMARLRMQTLFFDLEFGE